MSDTEKNKILPSTLYLVATPIGNLDDMTYRAVKTLTECDFIAAEDTRVTAKLLSAYGIKKSCVTYEEHSKRSAGEMILSRLKGGESCALVTDAGTPAISDPGEDLVRLCAENGINVVAVPGACAAVNALALSGLSTRRFVFEGFLEGKDNAKKERLNTLAGEDRSVIFYEAPHRLRETLSMMADAFGSDRRIAVCRELTKRNEEVLRFTLGDATEHFSKAEPKGEFVLVVDGRKDSGDAFWLDMSLPEHVIYYVEKMGLDKMSAVKAAAKDRGLPKNAVYKEFLNYENK
ncbi:MAG: 16S rRNA (cytidine(1402)-2'-O)-methyltransferase [Clostridia bacterium]|nr:16S rRNA (cytidine(1402)-2'-O)-methyltransferase [Clostridia bacterium]